MKTAPEFEAEIVRLHYAEHWKVGTIAAQLDAHPDVVWHVLGLSTARPPSQLRPRLVDPYRPFIEETLQRYPKLLATRLYDMIRERGYAVSIRTLREHVAAVRPKRRRDIYLSTETMPGEQAQVDWAYVDKLVVPGGERALWLFVMVMAHSRALWAEFVLDLSVHSLVRSLVRASAWFEVALSLARLRVHTHCREAVGCSLHILQAGCSRRARQEYTQPIPREVAARR